MRRICRFDCCLAAANRAHPMTGNMFEMDAIGATVLGGTALAGGRGRVSGSIIGAFVIVFLRRWHGDDGVSVTSGKWSLKASLSSPPWWSISSSKIAKQSHLMRRHEEKMAATCRKTAFQLINIIPPGIKLPGFGKNMQRNFQG